MAGTRSSLVYSLLAVLLMGAGCASAPQTVQGPKGRILDAENRLVRSIPARADIVIRPFSTEGVDLGTGGEGGKESRVEAAEKIKASGPGLLAASVALKLRESKRFGKVSTEVNAVLSPHTIVIEGKFLTINPEVAPSAIGSASVPGEAASTLPAGFSMQRGSRLPSSSKVGTPESGPMAAATSSS